MQRLLADDEEDAEGLGDVGKMSEQLATEAPFWRIVCTLGFSPREVDGWTIEEMRLAAGYMQMQNDCKRIWTPFYEMKREAESVETNVNVT